LTERFGQDTLSESINQAPDRDHSVPVLSRHIQRRESFQRS
jgi:hypothetical protein